MYYSCKYVAQNFKFCNFVTQILYNYHLKILYLILRPISLILVYKSTKNIINS